MQVRARVELALPISRNRVTRQGFQGAVDRMEAEPVAVLWRIMHTRCAPRFPRSNAGGGGRQGGRSFHAEPEKGGFCLGGEFETEAAVHYGD